MSERAKVGIVSMTEKKLSEQQRYILTFLLEHYQWVEAVGKTVNEWGVHWQTAGMSRSQQASLSRSLQRLEQRGLVIRQNQSHGTPGLPLVQAPWGGMAPRGIRESPDEPAPLRTDHVVLTDAGRLVAETVNKKDSPNVNR